MKEILSPAYSFKLKNNVLLLNRGFFFFFFQMVIFATLFWCCPMLWKSALKIRALFRRCLTLFILTLKYTTLFQRCWTFKFDRWRAQRCFNVDLTLCDVVTSYQPKSNVEPTLKCLLGIFFLFYFDCFSVITGNNKL